CCEAAYAAVVPTLADSTAERGVYFSVFFVRALTQVPAVYFDSPPDSGYSIGPAEQPEPGEYPEPPLQADYLGGNYPNPFNPATEIRFGLAAPGRAVIRIYDASGRLVRTLFDGEMPAGDHTAIWNGIDERGRAAASGVYFCRLEAGGFSKTLKMILLR
ncbi:MAG: FlgD immunoglobulin-like domain containing protein, partial [Candidatus Krumholzibacteria bacterium]|nr:FlgD immunoglobulin-like domain containing protein [Candidatus Krumholzibacteria bacterium]